MGSHLGVLGEQKCVFQLRLLKTILIIEINHITYVHPTHFGYVWLCCSLCYLYAEWCFHTYIYYTDLDWILDHLTGLEASSFHQFMKPNIRPTSPVPFTSIGYIWITTLFGQSLIVLLVLHVLLCITMHLTRGYI